MRKERIGLEHHVDGALVGRHRRDVLTVEQNGPFSRRLEPRKHPHQGGFTAARGAKQGEKLAGENREIQILDRGEVTEFLGHGSKLDQRRWLPDRSRPQLFQAVPKPPWHPDQM